MKILLVAATQFEIAPLLVSAKRVMAQGAKRKSIFIDNPIDILITGVGMTATAFHLGKIFTEKKYDLAINAGVAGSFKKNSAKARIRPSAHIPPGTVVNVVQDCFADFGAEDGNEFLTAEEINLVQSSEFRVQSSKFRNKTLNALPKAKAITVNTVHGNTSSIKRAVKKFNPDIESMEGAAFFFACNNEKTPCIQIRSVSNYVERRNKKNWKMDLAIRNLNLFLLEFLNTI